MFDDDSDPSHEDLIEMIGEFMTGSMRVADVYRSHLCDTLVQRVYDEFGTEGMAELMMKIDWRADWITDMLFDSNDLHDSMFKRHSTFDEEISMKARSTMAMSEMNKKIWNMRKRYVAKIVDEIWESDNPQPAAESTVL
jgi:hypothetical protein